MANNYCESSSIFNLKEKDIKEAKEIIDLIQQQLEDDPEEGYVGFIATIENNGIWIRSDESLSPEHVATLARRLVEDLRIDEPFIFSWAYTCSKLRPNEFGGGACAIKRGEKTYWIDATSEAENHFAKKEN